MKIIFYDHEKVVDVRDAAYVVRYTSTEVEYVLERGGTSIIQFGSKCNVLKDIDSDVCGMLQWKGIDTTVLDDFILSEYL